MSGRKHKRRRSPFRLPALERAKTITLGVLVAAAVGFFVFTMIEDFREPGSVRWYRSEGVVTQSWIEEREVDGEKVYETRLRYRYVVNDRVKRSARISEEPKCFPTEEEAQSWIDDWSVGQAVTVYYRNPQGWFPVLERPGGLGILAPALGAAGTIVFGFLLQRQWRRNARLRRQALGLPPAGPATPRPIASAGPLPRGRGYRAAQSERVRPTPTGSWFPRRRL